MGKKELLEGLIKKYRAKHKKSYAFFEKASKIQVRGGSHTIRLFDPFPFYDTYASGSSVTDLDGNTYVDFWQGHFANILGHNPKIILDALAEHFSKGQGLITGFPGTMQMELAKLILDEIKTDKIRFTTSGTLATMYAVMLAKAHTKKDLVMKAGGGWHGANPYLLKGISRYDHGLNRLESAGLPASTDSMIVTTEFNNIEDLEKKFRENGERIACFIVEPFIGAGGSIFSNKDYLARARELTHEYNSILIFDEVISGYRFHPGGLQTLYGIKPDLTVLGKIIGGGMPVSAVAGSDDVMSMCSPERKDRVRFEGGTFSAHPASMLAGITCIRYLKQHPEIYPRIGRLGDKVRKGIEEIFNAHGFNVRCTGGGSIPSSIAGVHFLKKDISIDRIESPDQTHNPEICDVELSEKIFKLAMLDEGFNIAHGFGAISAAHNKNEIDNSLVAVENIARIWRRYLQ